MYLLNNGYITVPATNIRELVFFLDAAGIEVEECNGKDESIVKVEINELCGDIGADLARINSRFSERGILLNGEITYTGEYDGKYVITNGEFIDLDHEKVVIWDASTEVLYKELRRREAKNNAERIRRMTDEELAEWFNTVTKDVLDGSTWDKKEWLKWLQTVNEDAG